MLKSIFETDDFKAYLMIITAVCNFIATAFIIVLMTKTILKRRSK